MVVMLTIIKVVMVIVERMFAELISHSGNSNCR